MKAYHYSIVRCRDPKFLGEERNVGLIVLCPAMSRAWVRRGGLTERARLIADDAGFVRSLLEVVQREASEVAAQRDARVAHGWLRARSMPSEDVLQFSAPGMGSSDDVAAEVSHLRSMYLGARGGGAARVKKTRQGILDALRLTARFQPHVFKTDTVAWRFDCVATGPRPVVFNAVQLGQKTPENILDATFKNVGRALEVQEHVGEVTWVTLVDGPEAGPHGRADARATTLLDRAGLGVVEPTPDAVARMLQRAGWSASGDATAEA